MNRLFLIFALTVFHFISQAQNQFLTFPVKTPEGRTVTIEEIANGSSTVVLSFWATWCNPCLTELDAVSESIGAWQSETDFVFVAVSIDDARSGTKVRSMVNGKCWNFAIVLDENQNIKRLLAINNIPGMVILKNGEIKYRHTGYLPGDEEILFGEILRINE